MARIVVIVKDSRVCDQLQKLASKQELLHEVLFQGRQYCQRELLVEFLSYLKIGVTAQNNGLWTSSPSYSLQHVQTASLVLFHVALNEGNEDPVERNLVQI